MDDIGIFFDEAYNQRNIILILYKSEGYYNTIAADMGGAVLCDPRAGLSAQPGTGKTAVYGWRLNQLAGIVQLVIKGCNLILVL